MLFISSFADCKIARPKKLRRSVDTFTIVRGKTEKKKKTREFIFIIYNLSIYLLFIFIISQVEHWACLKGLPALLFKCLFETRGKWNYQRQLSSSVRTASQVSLSTYSGGGEMSNIPKKTMTKTKTKTKSKFKDIDIIPWKVKSQATKHTSREVIQ